MFGIRTLFGLPLHVLVVHFAVVLVPLAALALILTGWRPDWRRSYSLLLAVLAIIGAGAAFLAAHTGGQLRRSLREKAFAAGTRANFAGHPGSGNRAEFVAAVFALAVVGMWVAERWGSSRGWPSWAATASYGAASVFGLLAIVTMVLAGHSGAALVWKDLGNFVSAG